jgi:hypothetical protein
MDKEKKRKRGFAWCLVRDACTCVLCAWPGACAVRGAWCVVRLVVACTCHALRFVVENTQ